MVTVLGASGFIGSNLVQFFKANAEDVYAPKRDEDITNKKLGHVIYCIGLTADFRNKPFETIDAHICKLKNVLECCDFESITYLSSTRVYIKSKTNNKKLSELDDLIINPNDPADIFSTSKLSAELLLLNSRIPNIKILRVSNVFGDDFKSENFLTSILRDALIKKQVELQTTADSSKDYISIDDVCQMIASISTMKVSGIYNVSYGSNTRNDEVTSEIAKLTGARIIYQETAKKIVFKEIDNSKVCELLKYTPKKTLKSSLPEMIESFSKNI